MKKEKIFSKFNTRNFNNELEEVLSQKPFSENAKNHILSMVYKIEESYNDYSSVKIEVQNEKEFLYTILKAIKECCNSIQILNTIDSEEKYIIDYDKGKIKVIPNNVYILEALLELVSEKETEIEYDLLKEKPIYDFLVLGDKINNVEVLRDFNGWSWSISKGEIGNINANLIYQNLQFLIGNKLIDKFIKVTIHKKDWVMHLKNKLKSKYEDEISKQIIDLLRKIAITEIASRDKVYGEKILEIKESKQKELDLMANKKEYLKNISNIKKEKFESIKNIDKLINNSELLKNEYKNRNKYLKNDEKIFSVSCLVDILNEERKEALIKIEEINKLMEPKNYIAEKEELKSIIDETSIDKEKLLKNVTDFQKIFIKCLEKDIYNLTDKLEIISYFNKVRYYIHLLYEESVYIKDVKELQKEIENLKKLIVQKLLESKLIIGITEDNDINSKILMNILNTRIINLKAVYVELKKGKEEMKLEIYDEDELSFVENIAIKDLKKINIKSGKKVKLFL